MTWPVAKIDLINSVLALSGNNLCNVPEDGSDEWTVGSAAYELAIEYMFDAHDWKQITNVVTLQPTGSAPSDDQFDTTYTKPPNCIHVIWVRLNDVPVSYQILSDQIVVNAAGGPPAVPSNKPGVVTVKYVSSAPPFPAGGGPAGVQNMQRTFMVALNRFVLAGVYRGLHEDIASARAEEQAARELLQEAKTRSDQEQGKRAPFNSRLREARRIRRPWPTTPVGWGGTGGPG